MFDTLLIITSFLLASLLVCLLTLRLNINIKHFMSLFSFTTDIIGYFDNLTKISNHPVYFEPPAY